MNPFILKGYKGSGYFCDREEDTAKLLNAITNEQDVTLFAYRRLGKSALIHHTFAKLPKDYKSIYIDIWGTSDVHGFTKELANGIAKSKLFSKRKLSEKLSSFIKAIGASFSFGLDGSPQLNLSYSGKESTFRSLEEIFGFLNELNEKIVIAIDEFQEIKKYDDEMPFEGKLRGLVQQSKNITFIFSGSEQHLLNEIFNKYTKPFYQSTRTIQIEKIDLKKYKKFIIGHFKKASKPIKEDIVDHILNITYNHTYYVQAVANFVFSLDAIPQSIDEFTIKYKEYILEKSVFYTELPERLTKQQFVVLKSFALEGIVAAPNSGDFLRKSGLNSASSMQRVINSLIEKQLLIKEPTGYRLYDVFLGQFLVFTL